MLGKWLAQVNALSLWRNPVSVRGMTFSPPTLDRWVALQAHRFGLMGKAEFLFFDRTIRPHWRIADVGANQGLYTVYFSRQAADGRVYAFEPDPDLFAKLKENTQRNNRGNVSLFNAAIASQPDKLSFRAGRFNRGDNRIVPNPTSPAGTIEVDAIPLDHAIPERKLNLLKVDVQGFEVQVLRGAKGLLECNSDLLVLLEFWPHGLRLAGPGPEELLSILAQAGFSLFRLVHTAHCEPFIYRVNEWSRPTQFCNLIATRGRNPSAA
jgi:FkbM family methyltransferase